MKTGRRGFFKSLLLTAVSVPSFLSKPGSAPKWEGDAGLSDDDLCKVQIHILKQIANFDYKVVGKV